MFILETGTNHLGKIHRAERFISFFIKSSFQKMTFMCQSDIWYKKKLKSGKNFQLPKSFYIKKLKLLHKKNKQLGLSVCDTKTYNNLKDINFDFYKLLSISINNYELIEMLKKKNKPVYISSGFNASYSQISKCLKKFGNYKKIILLHTPMVKKHDKLNFKKINQLRKKFKINIGYSNHFFDFKTLFALTSYNLSAIMLYIKPSEKTKIKYPDDAHAVKINKLEELKKNYENILRTH